MCKYMFYVLFCMYVNVHHLKSRRGRGPHFNRSLNEGLTFSCFLLQNPPYGPRRETLLLGPHVPVLLLDHPSPRNKSQGLQNWQKQPYPWLSLTQPSPIASSGLLHSQGYNWACSVGRQSVMNFLEWKQMKIKIVVPDCRWASQLRICSDTPEPGLVPSMYVSRLISSSSDSSSYSSAHDTSVHASSLS